MIDRIEMFLDCNDILKRKLKIFIEYFIKYYGEDKRQEIEKQFSKMLSIGYMTPQRRKNTLNRLIKEESNILQEVILSKTDLPFSKKDLFGTYGYDTLNLLPIQDLYKLKELYDKSKKERLKDFINEGYEFTKRYFPKMTKFEYLCLRDAERLTRELPDIVKNNIKFYLNRDNADNEFKKTYKKALPLLQKIEPNITFSDLDKIFKNDKVKLMLESYQESLVQFELFKQDHREHFSTVEKTRQIETLLKDKYYILYLKENIDLIPESERSPIYDFLEGKTKNLYPNTYISTILGYSLGGTSILEYFSSENDEKLTNEKHKWSHDSIKESRIKYFKTIGLDLGDNYDEYLNNPECQAKWPSKELVERVINSRNNYINKFNNEFFNSISEYQEIRRKIDSLGLLDEDSFNAKLLTDSGTFINPNVRLTEEGYDVFSLFVIGFNDLDCTHLDHNIVHELNHLYEMFLSKITEKSYEAIVGWDYATGRINGEKQTEVDTINIDREKRKYELFNEIVNELIAQDICEMMHNDNVTVFDEQENSQYKHTTSYEDYLVLVSDFFKEFKDKIIASRRNGNIEVIFNEVGKENFDELNSLIQEFYENFKEFKIYSLRTALRKDEDTEQTRIYYDLLKRRNIILDNMRNYKKENKMTM